VSTYQNGFSALADPTRRDIFERLATRPSAVGELAEGLPVSRPAVSQHLRVLRDAGLVTGTRDGTRRLYRVDPDGVARMRAYLDRFWTEGLAAFREAAAQQEER
jgi:DNA-binding transcriptional ArsR family regulator